ncbi:3-oxoacyl-[acyl-carrier-protein] synthase 2 [Pseudovibrio axinellae]|uniref:3-oxoacyl-[acyl-carrier-protein] synthase 2 n=1 Tax=Pseudovibrio axinellae TaxID=989403 RepID=A0A161VB57_9HYPH|nr:beta-ketoacyl-ACP synthase II [Pseudovibrio axinellae]KZL21324.1 3-oxoacyl-[acyl-carrier-protein] synthase 2 [Pseudovibrio axinellae]SEQ96151.1 3-oxoacyl-[acyl-carrier-protein] synthase II [Pseudovibrio axinellae]
MRIVVTGMGVVSPLGVGTNRFWEQLIASKSGIRALSRFDGGDQACQIAGEVPGIDEDEFGFDASAVISRRDQKRMDLFIHYALVAAKEALTQAGWAPETDEEREDTATIIASGVGGFLSMKRATLLVESKGPSRLSPFVVPAFLANLAAGQVSIAHGFQGPLGTPVTACAASVQAIGDAVRLLRSGEAQVALAGGAEACIDSVSFAGFSAARALSSGFNGDPAKASRPFDRDRDGFVMGEGSAMLVLESLDHALARGATPLAEVMGYGTSADAYHVTASPPDGSGGQKAMRKALKQAGIEPDDIDYINAHSTSTPIGDAAEIAGIQAVFGDRGKDLAISSTKSATGHLLGAAGAIEAIAAIMALREGILPPTLNLDNPDDVASQYELVANTAKEKELDYVMSNGFGFGGVNASLIFGKPN